MNITYLTTLNPYDINVWSGTPFHMLHALNKVHNVEVIGQSTLIQTAYYARNNYFKQRSFDNYIPILGKVITEQISTNCDLIFFGDLFLVPSLLIDVPIVHLSDVNYHVFKDYLNEKDETKIKTLEKLEKELLEKYTKIIYSSEWAKKNTIDYYQIDSDKIHVVEFGANIPTPLDYQIDIQTNCCNLVFIGKNWEKKGGDKVLGAFKKLKSDGFQCSLTIIGSAPQVPYDDYDDLIVIPFLDKSKPEHLKKICNILKEAHFLVLPTEFEAYGIVFCEASAYGVPSIAANVGGVSQPVREGENGYLLPSDASAEDYAEKIKSVFNDKENYQELRISSRREFETRLNWNVWSQKVNEIFEETILAHKNRGNKSK